jgi:hypothetical protein
VLRFTDQVGQAVQAADGTPAGRLRDVTIDLDDAEPVVRRLVVGTRRRIHRFVDWDTVDAFSPDLVQLAPEVAEADLDATFADDLPLDHGELLLGRDVLDTQVVDVTGGRLARVGDVLMTRLDDGRLLVGAVDVGFGAVCRRLGLHTLAVRLGDEAVGWDALHLTSARGHRVQLRTSKAAMHRLDEQELAQLVSRLSVAAGAEVLGAVNASKAGAALARSGTDVAAPLMVELSGEQLDRALDTLPNEEARQLRSIRARPRRRRFLRHRRRRARQPATAMSTEAETTRDGDER